MSANPLTDKWFSQAFAARRAPAKRRRMNARAIAAIGSTISRIIGPASA
jgi:hypothetical protein